MVCYKYIRYGTDGPGWDCEGGIVLFDGSEARWQVLAYPRTAIKLSGYSLTGPESLAVSCASPCRYRRGNTC